ncbi:MAG: hypothetical protein ABIL22_09660, partial [candidate division WOR-3 bacterium]
MSIFVVFLLSTLADRIAVVVGDEVILEGEGNEYVSFVSTDPNFKQRFATSEELLNTVINGLVSRRLMLAQA